jgi:hypothetical protein
MKVIFLDNDGVICLSDNWGSRSKKARKWMIENDIAEHTKEGSDKVTRPVDVRFDNFDKKAIKVLNSVLEETGAEIVVSSDWKLYATLEELGDYYESQGIIKRPIATTENLRDFDPESYALFAWKGWRNRERITEIKRWLEAHPEVTDWVAIDDINMGYVFHDNSDNGGLTNFVLTPRSNEGIKQSGIKDKLLKYLL